MRAFPELLRERQSFRDVIVAPIEFCEGCMFRGGPVWPRYALQIGARCSYGRFPFPRDRRPISLGAPVAEMETATWCGPIVHHFGHAVADHGMRLAASAFADPTQPLLFGMPTTESLQPPDFFWQMLDHYGIDRARVLLVRDTILVRLLHVFSQAERRGGSGPSRKHLDFLDRALTRAAPRRIGGAVYVSRSRLRESRNFPAGEIAGEAYLERLLAERGVRIVHPERLTLSEQLDIYRHARQLIFAEGSALHGLQLLGRFEAEVIVIARRHRNGITGESIRPRARSLTIISALRGMVYGLNGAGRPDRVRALAILRPERLLARLARAGLDLSSCWNEAAYTAQRDADIAAWRQATLAQGFNPRSDAVIARCLERLSLASK